MSAFAKIENMYRYVVTTYNGILLDCYTALLLMNHKKSFFIYKFPDDVQSER